MTGEQVTETVATNVLGYRSRRGWSQQELADRMTAYGYPWQRSTIAKIEGQMRQVTAPELVALAFALGISPIALIAPRSERDPSEPGFKVTPNTTFADTVHMWTWCRGDSPNGGTLPGELQTPANERFYYEAAPDHEALAEERLPGLRNLRRWPWNVQVMVGRWIGRANVIRALQLMRDDVDDALRRAERLEEAD